MSNSYDTLWWVNCLKLVDGILPFYFLYETLKGKNFLLTKKIAITSEIIKYIALMKKLIFFHIDESKTLCQLNEDPVILSAEKEDQSDGEKEKEKNGEEKRKRKRKRKKTAKW